MILRVAVVLCVMLVASIAHAETLGDGWQFRRPLNFKQAVTNGTGLTGDNVAWAEFYANGTQKSDGSDFRVTTADRVIVPFKILQMSSSNDLVRIAFATRGEAPYYVWWGNPAASKPTADLDIQRGILLQISESAGGDVRAAKSADGLQQMMERATPRGALFVPEIFLGYNPLGDEVGDFFHYTAQFRIDKPAAAEFAFSVMDSGTLSIDGEPILHEFHGGWKARVRNSKSVDLTTGWHRIDVIQVNLGRDPASGVSVVWKRLGESAFSPMPANIFAPIAHADAGMLQKVGGGRAADILALPAAETFIPPDGYGQRYTFEASIPPLLDPKISWDFGDGQTGGPLKNISHEYLSPGIYAVTLRLAQGDTTVSTTIRIAVKDRMYSLFPRPPEDNSKTVIAVLDDYDLKKLSGAASLRGMQFFKSIGDSDDAVSWGRAWLLTKDYVNESTLNDETLDLVQMLESHRDYTSAAEFYHLASLKPVGLEARLNFMRDYVMEQCDFFDDATPALREAMDWQKRINDGNSSQVRIADAAIIYAAIAQGDGKIAQDTIDHLHAKGGKPITAYNQARIRQGVLARNIEAYIRTKDFSSAQKLIDDWELEYPEAIWDGFTRALRVKLNVAEDRPLVAARIALEHARANPTGFYAAELLYRAAQSFQAGDQSTQAKAAMDLLTSKYPESPYARPDAPVEK